MMEGELLGVLALTWKMAVMIGVGGLLIYLGIAREVEPMLLVPIGMGIVLANIPLGGLTEGGGLLSLLRQIGIDNELFPLLIFISVGAMIDFGPLLERPYTVLLGAAAQFGLFGTLMFGNLLRESGVLERLSNAAQNELANIVTILLGLTVGGMMLAEEFLRLETIMIFVMGVVAFAVGTATGVVFGKVMYLLSGKKINPLIGAAGISAFPMSARVVQKVGLEANPHNHLLMHAAGANTAGQIASVVAGGAVLMLVPLFT